MMLRREITAQIKEVLEKHPEGLSITDLVKSVDINRNTAGRYLENLLLSGQVEMRRFGMSKMYTLAKRLPVSSVLSMSSEFFLQLDLSQRIIYANEPFLRFLGSQAKDLLGKNIEFSPFSTVFEDDFSYLLDRFRRGLKGEEWRGELVHPVHGRILFCRVAPTVFNEGAKGVSILLEDITDQKLDAERIRESEFRLRSIFKVSPIGIGVIVNRTFSEVNDRFCQITGYSTAEMIGKSVRMLYSSEEEFRNVGMLYMNQIRETGFGSVETQWVKKGGTLIDVLLNTTPLDPSNISGGITFTALDITERKQSEQALRDSEERLHLALSASETGMWEMDFPSGKGSIDEGAAAILGYASDEIGTLQADWDALSHPDDVPLIMKRITDYLEGRTSMFESEHRMRHKSGHWIWVLGRGKITSSPPDGSCKRISGTLKDITARKMARQALQESEEKLQLALDGSEMGMWEVEIPSGKGSGDERCSAIFGYRGEEAGGRQLDWEEVTHPDDLPFVRRKLADHIAGRTPMFESEHRMRHKSGKWIWVIGRGRVTPPLPDGSRRVIGTMLDITARKTAEQALQESEEKYRHLVEESLQGLTIIQNGRPVYANTAMLEIGGYPSLDEYLALSAESMMATIHPDDRDRIGRVMADRLAGKDIPPENEFRVLRRDGEVRWVLSRGAQITYNGTPAIQITYFDITERKLAERSLSESEERLRQVMETLTTGVFYIHDRASNKFIYVSPAYEKIWKRSCQSLYDDQYTYLEAVHPDDKPRLLDAIRRELEEGMYVDSEYRIVQPNGAIRWIHSRNYPILDLAGNVYRVAGIAEDITTRRTVEDALRESEDRYRKLVEISPNAIILHQDGKIIYANQSLARLLGVEKPEDLYGREILNLIHPVFRGAVRENIAKDLSGESSPFTELQLIRGDGSVVFAEGQGVGTIIDGRPAVLVTIADVSERYATLRALRESEEKYRSLVEQSLQGYLLVRDGRVVYANPAMQRIMGYTPDEYMALGPEELGKTVHPDDRDRMQEFAKNPPGGDLVSAGNEYRIIRKDGTIGWIRSQSTMITLDGLPALQVTVLDITDRKMAEDTLRASENRYRTLAEASRDLIFVISRDDRVEYVNSFAATLVGLPADKVIGKPRSSLFSGELGERQYQSLRRVFDTGKPGRSEGPMTIAGSLHWFDHLLMPIPGADGTVITVLGVSRDITDRRGAEETLRDNEERYRTLVEQTFDAVAVHKDGNIVSLNERAARILGAATPQELTGRPVIGMIHPDSRKDLEERLRVMADEPRNPAPVLREKFFRIDGSVVTVDVIAVRIIENGQPAVKVWFREVF